MSKTAFVFPGQGSQFVGMGQDLFDAFSEVRSMYQTANDILEFDLAKLCFEGPEEALKQTNVTQPAIFVHSVALNHLLLQNGFQPELLAGHSLGEYSALHSAGAFDFQDGLKLVKTRGELMQKAGEINQGTMAAVMGLDADVLDSVCDEASAAGVVRVANYNSPIQIVISGAIAGVERAMEIARDRGARKVVPLVVGGAFHSPLMEFAIEGLTEMLDSVSLQDVKVPVYSNVTAGPVTSSVEIKTLLLKQLTSPVRWAESVTHMIADGAGSFCEVGPGTVLTGLLKRISRDVNSRNFNSLESVNSLQDQ